MAVSAALQQAAMACAKARVVKGGYGSLRSGDPEARTLSSRGAGTLRDGRGARTGTTRRRAAPTDSEAGDGGNQGGRLPSWAREAVSRGGKDPDEVDRTLARAKEESDAMSVGMGILMRDMRRGLPLAAMELAGEKIPFVDPPPLDALEARRASVARRDLRTFLAFSFIFLNTIPWTPLVLPVVLKVGDVTGLFGRESVIPTQLDRKKDKRLDVLLSRRRKNE